MVKRELRHVLKAEKLFGQKLPHTFHGNAFKALNCSFDFCREDATTRAQIFDLADELAKAEAKLK